MVGPKLLRPAARCLPPRCRSLETPACPRYRLAAHRPAATLVLRCPPNPVCCPAIYRRCQVSRDSCSGSLRSRPDHHRPVAASPGARAAHPAARLARRPAGHLAGCLAVRRIARQVDRRTGPTPGWTTTVNLATRPAGTHRLTAARSRWPKDCHSTPAAPATGCSNRTNRRSVTAATEMATHVRPGSGSGSGSGCRPKAMRGTKTATMSPAVAASRATRSNCWSCNRRGPGHRPPATQGARCMRTSSLEPPGGGTAPRPGPYPDQPL